MKILHITPAYYPATYWGGPIYSVYALNNALACIPDIKLKVLTTDAAGPKVNERLVRDELGDLYPDQEVLMTRRVAGACISMELMRRLPSMVQEADVVHLTAAYSFPTIPVLLLCRLYGKPLVWSPRGAMQDAHEWQGSRRRILKRWWERVCNLFISPGMVMAHVTVERERVATQLRIPRAKAVIVPNGVTVPEALPARDWLREGQLHLMFMGRLSPKKGVENLLEAMGHHLGERDVVLTLYGTGDPPYVAHLESLARQLALTEGRVRFAGHVDGVAREKAFAEADLCVVPSHTENFCMVVAEALARGVPVIASHGTPWEALDARGCGLWVANDPQSLADAIIRMEDAELEKMGALGREWMMDEFTWGAVAQRMRDVYESFPDQGLRK